MELAGRRGPGTVTKERGLRPSRGSRAVGSGGLPPGKRSAPPGQHCSAHVEIDRAAADGADRRGDVLEYHGRDGAVDGQCDQGVATAHVPGHLRSEEHTSELQSRENLVCRLLLEKKKKKKNKKVE